MAGSASYTPGQRGWFQFDILNAVHDFIETPSSNHGLMIFSNGHVNPRNGGCLSWFASPDDTTASLRPKLSITYTIPTGVLDRSNRYTLPASHEYILTVYSIKGQKVTSRRINTMSEIVPLSRSFPQGIYYAHISVPGKSVIVKKLRVVRE